MFNILGTVICSLTIVFHAGWKLSFLVLLFVPFLIFSGILQGRRMSNSDKKISVKGKNASWPEKGRAVRILE